MKKLLLLALLSVCLTATAQQVSSQQALEKARKFVSSNRPGKQKAMGTAGALRQVSQQQILSGTRGDQLFIYNVGTDNGFVIVSGDERTPDILGYADKGSIDPQNMPENMRSLLEDYVSQINSLTPYSNSRSKSSYAPVMPMITAEWDQNNPYNLQCPTKSGKLCVTGCVATAMSQILYYVRPDGCTALPGYSGLASLPATTFNWGIMRDTYKSSDNDASASEVAKLMRYCGQSVNMTYGTGSSAASTEKAIDAFINNFGISKSCTRILRENYSAEEWEHRLYAELAEGRPMIFSGRNIEGGHAFICDGYDGSGLYHINWGWSGSSNGFFFMNRLSPKHQGTGGTNNGYNNELWAMIGIKQKTGPEVIVHVMECDRIASVTPTKPTRADVTKDFTITINADVWNISEIYNTYEFCWGLFDEAGNMLQTSVPETMTYEYLHGKINRPFTIALGRNIASGNYYIKPLSHNEGETEWGLCKNYNVSTLPITISATSATITVPAPHGTYWSYAISNFQITGNHIANAKQDVSFNVKNNGDYYSSSVYIVVDETLTEQVALDLDPGESTVITSSLSFASAGTHSVKLAKKVLGDSYETLLTTSYTVDPESYGELSFKLKPESYTDIEGSTYIVDSRDINIVCEMTNARSTAYKSVVELWGSTASDGYVYSNESTFAVVQGSGKATVTCPFTGLPDGEEYRIYAASYNGPESYNIDWSSKVLVKYDSTVTGITDLTASPAPSAPAYSADGRRVGDSYRGIVIRNGKKFMSK